MSQLAIDYLFTHGFPRDRSRPFQMVQGIASKSLPYGAMQRLERLPDQLAPSEFAIDFDPLNMISLTASGDDFVSPHGMSGAPVWRIGVAGKSTQEWRPECALLAGFLTRYDQEQRLLIATGFDMLRRTVEDG